MLGSLGLRYVMLFLYSSQVFVVRCPDGALRALKEVSLAGFDYAALQHVLTSFARELYLLNNLKHERVVSLYGAVACTHKLGLVMEYMRRGSLRKILDTLLQASRTDADADVNAHAAASEECDVILQDVAEGIAFLHSRYD